MITTLIRKLLEKQTVENRFASYEVHIGHFLCNVNATVSFGNRLITLSIFGFHWTGRKDKTNCLTLSRMVTIIPLFAYCFHGGDQSAHLRILAHNWVMNISFGLKSELVINNCCEIYR